MPTLNWIGKQKVVNHHLDVPVRSLVQTGGHGDSALGGENRIIHGDNLEALKALLPEYEGRVKCIYIDPPYNTGNEGWVYNDNVNDPRIKRWLHQVVGREGEDLSRHDKWLCMMYPRLKLLHRLLAEDGLIFISIDDYEVDNALQLMDIIFGRRCRVACAPVLAEPSGGKEKTGLRGGHEYILIYHNGDLSCITQEERSVGELNLKDKIGPYRKGRELRKWGGTSNRSDRENQWFPLLTPNGETVFPIKNDGTEGHWRWGKDQKMKDIVRDPENAHWEKCAFDQGVIVNGQTERWVPFEKIRNKKKMVGWGTWLDNIGFNSDATRELKEIFGSKPFDTPKPVSLIEWMISLHQEDDAIVLDSFAGSGTTAHAVLKLNAEDGGNRRFILIEMMDYADSLTAERVRRVIDGYGPPEKAVAGLGGGFGYYELGPTIFTPDGGLNPETSWDQLARYVWYAETGRGDCINPDAAIGCLGLRDGTAYFLHPAAPGASVLDARFLRGVGTKAERYVVYADTCSLAADFMAEHNIAFRKLPRDLPGSMSERRT